MGCNGKRRWEWKKDGEEERERRQSSLSQLTMPTWIRTLPETAKTFLLFFILPGPSHSFLFFYPPSFFFFALFLSLSLRPLSLLQCITNSDRENGYNSSLQLPDATLNFAKKHPLMEDKALARPLLLTKGINFTRLAVDRVSALDQRAYNMLFIGTGTNYMKTFFYREICDANW